MNVEVTIDRLILKGISLPPGERPAFQAAVEAELARLLAEGGVSPALAAGAAVPLVRTGGLQMVTGESATGFGTRVAQAVYGGLAQ